MKQALFFICLLVITHSIVSQESIQNFGNLKIHDSGSIGFHYNLINTGVFNDNLGLVGFFNDSNELTISGSDKPVFNDMEVLVDNNLYFDVSVGVTNNLNFIIGDIITPRNTTNISLDFTSNSFYNGQNNLRKVDGYVSIANKQSFIFPIGDENELRPLFFQTEELFTNAKSAYFKEDPDFSVSLNSSFPVTEKGDDVTTVSNQEFWQLKSLELLTVTLSWNSTSAIEDITDAIENIVVVGWNINNSQWEMLGATSVNGNLEEGFVTSSPFIPNEYEILTFGSIANPSETTDFGDYIITPNGDGSNDFFVIRDMPENNVLKIYNRYGALVYEKKDYTNEFKGVSNSKMTVSSGSTLPAAVYFYVIIDSDSNEEFQGYLYIAVE